MSVDVQAKAQAIADIIEGKVIDDSDRVAVCVRGVVMGFRSAFEAMNTGWPFGVMYTVESHVAPDPNQPVNPFEDPKITIYPRIGRGMMGIITKLLLFESGGQPVGDKKLEKDFNFSYDDRDVAERFVHYPGMREHLQVLEDVTKFSEIIIRTKVGIYLAQPTNFNSLDLDVCRSTFRTLGEIAQILFEAF